MCAKPAQIPNQITFIRTETDNQTMSLLPPTDLETITKRLNRPPNPVEEGCFLNLRSEHCSYRSSAKHLRTFPTESDCMIIGPGDDAARPIVLANLFCFGMPDQQKNLYLFEHVVEGIAGYGNCIGMAQGMKIRMVAA